MRDWQIVDEETKIELSNVAKYKTSNLECAIYVGFPLLLILFAFISFIYGRTITIIFIILAVLINNNGNRLLKKRALKRKELWVDNEVYKIDGYVEEKNITKQGYGIIIVKTEQGTFYATSFERKNDMPNIGEHVMIYNYGKDNIEFMDEPSVRIVCKFDKFETYDL